MIYKVTIFLLLFVSFVSIGSSTSTESIPDSPKHLRAISLPNGVVRLWWNLSDSSNIVKYEIYSKREDEKNYHIIDNVAGNLQSWESKQYKAISLNIPFCNKFQIKHPSLWFSNKYLLPGYVYLFKVRAIREINSDGRIKYLSSDYSNTATKYPIILYPTDYLNQPTTIVDDNRGNVYIGTEGGLIQYVFSDSTYSTIIDTIVYTEWNGLISRKISSLAIDSDRHLWIGTDKGLCHFDSNIWRVYTTEDGLSDNEITCIYGGRGTGDGGHTVEHLFIGTARGVNVIIKDVNIVANEKWFVKSAHSFYEIYTTKVDDTIEKISALYSNIPNIIQEIIDENLDVISNTFDSRSQLNYDEIKNVKLKDGLKIKIPLPTIDRVVKITSNAENKIFVATQSSGVYSLSSQTFNDSIRNSQSTIHNDLMVIDTLYNSAVGSLPSDNISNIFIDSDDNLWIGTDKGLTIIANKSIPFTYNKTNAKLFRITGNISYLSLSLGGITSIIEDSQKDILVGTDSGILAYSKLMGGGFYILGKESIASLDDEVRFIYQARKGYLFVVTRFGGVSRCRFGMNWTSVTSNIDARFVYQPKNESADKLLFIATNNKKGMFILRNDELKSFLIDDKVVESSVLSPSDISLISQDSYNNLWIGTMNNGLIQYNVNDKSLRRYTSDYKLINNNVHCILNIEKPKSKGWSIWVGTNGGATYFSSNGETMSLTADKLGSNEVTSILRIQPTKSNVENFSERIFFATIGGGVAEYQSETGKITRWLPPDIVSEDIISLKADANNNIITVSEYLGLCRYNFASKKWETIQHPIFVEEVKDVLVDRMNNIWIGTGYGGVGRYNVIKNEWTIFDKKHNNLSSDFVQTMLEDKQGNIWIGTRGGGISKFDSQTQKMIPFDASEIITNSVYSIIQNRRGDIIAGTSDGLVIYSYNKSIFNSNSLNSEISNYRNNFVISSKIVYPKELFGGNGIKIVADGFYYGSVYDGWKSNLQPSRRFQSTIDCLWLGIDGGGLGIVEYKHLPLPLPIRIAGNIFPYFVILVMAMWIYFYLKTPNYLARVIYRKFKNDSDEFYNQIYNIFEKRTHPDKVLQALYNRALRKKRKQLAEVIIAYKMLSPVSEDTLEQALKYISVAMLRLGDTYRFNKQLCDIYEMFFVSYQADSPSKIYSLITELDKLIAELKWEIHLLTEKSLVRVGDNVPTVQEPNYSPQVIFRYTLDVITMMRDIANFLGNYESVDNAEDKGLYLSKSLGIIMQMQDIINKKFSHPEKNILLFISERWRKVISNALEELYAKAVLDIKLKSKEIIIHRFATIVLEITNIGKGYADNVSLRLLPNEKILTSTEEKNLGSILPKKVVHSEFRITPQKIINGDSIKVEFIVVYDDKEKKGKEIRFVDDICLKTMQAKEFKELEPNPYIVGRPLKSGEMFVGRNDIFNKIKRDLKGEYQDNIIVLYGQRRTGKTSILYQLQDILKDDYISVLIDIQGMIDSGTDLFFYELATSVKNALKRDGFDFKEINIDEIDFKSAPSSKFKNEFLSPILQNLKDKKIVFMFDEFEVLEDRVNSGKIDKDIFQYIRSLIQHSDKIEFIFAGTHRIDEMSNSLWSILSNVAIYEKVDYLLPSEAKKLITEPVNNYFIYDDMAIDKIIQITAGHPHFLQLICREVVNYRNDNQLSYITIDDVNKIINRVIETGGMHIMYIWQELSDDDRMVLSAINSAFNNKGIATLSNIMDILASQFNNAGNISRYESVIKNLVNKDIIIEEKGQSYLNNSYRFKVELLRYWLNKS